MGGTTTQTVADTNRVRLHITPLNPSLLDRFIPPSLQSQATNISFHTIETRSESGFGYIELPTVEAQKLKKKFNGTTLKGMKVRIEDAKPEKKRKGVGEGKQGEDETPSKKIKREKRKHEDGVLSGHELSDGRHVKRGWTADPAMRRKDKTSRPVEVPVEKRKVQFKAKIPPNAGANDSKTSDSLAKSKSKTKKPGIENLRKTVVVKEFSKTSKAKQGNVQPRQADLTYEVGRGWIDDEDNVVEPEPPSRKIDRLRLTDTTQSQPKNEDDPSSDSDPDSVSSSEVSSILTDSDNDDEVDDEADRDISSDESLSDAPTPKPSTTQTNQPSPTIEVHPLEALFKRAPPSIDYKPRAPDLAPLQTSFNFFDSPNEVESSPIDTHIDIDHPPQTPHTREDLQWRSIRSAAPTPDTAAIGKRFSLSLADEQDDEDDEDDGDADATAMRRDTPTADGTAVSKVSGVELAGKEEESPFRKWFYENRGDLNRAWKTRRREEKKVARQRENRRVGSKIA